MNQPLIEHKISPDRATAAYLTLLDTLDTESFSRAEVMTALVALMGTQFNGGVLPEDRMARFVNDCTDWMAAYFATGASH